METARECCERCERTCDKKQAVTQDVSESDKKEQVPNLFSAGYVAASWQLTWLSKVGQEEVEK